MSMIIAVLVFQIVFLGSVAKHGVDLEAKMKAERFAERVKHEKTQ